MIRITFTPTSLSSTKISGIVEFYNYGSGSLGQCIGSIEKGESRLFPIEGQDTLPKLPIQETDKAHRMAHDLMNTYFAANNGMSAFTWSD